MSVSQKYFSPFQKPFNVLQDIIISLMTNDTQTKVDFFEKKSGPENRMEIEKKILPPFLKCF